MGIKQLMQLINEKASGAVKKLPLDRYSGQIVACDASMAMYQFLIATQFSTKSGLGMLTDSDGNHTAHLLGLFNRTIMFLENRVKPIWVFDGRPPTMKAAELEKRKKAKEEAEENVEKAIEEGKEEDIKKFGQRTIRITPEMKEDAMQMLRLMGVPVIQAPCEAEAQCAHLVKLGKAQAVASEDMDSLTFGATYLLRGFNSKKEPIVEISYNELLAGLELNQREFIDLCILLGCDYTEHISGIGPVTGYKLIKQYGTIERVVDHISGSDKKKYAIPQEFNFEGARELFLTPEVDNCDGVEIQWNAPNEAELSPYLIVQKGFAQARVDAGIQKLKKIQGRPAQLVLEHFFGKAEVVKRKAPEPKGSAKKSKKK
ncbi:unnamed protein product [Blepharisma stoltei]|uniref:Flap endonuclease 1 n=1 Tax=Blepharisma stoltei TaxID=1481888 RepID=A0AAU9JNS7_9CILI|nr:unnamed protein product [Blepharisma stoltei]